MSHTPGVDGKAATEAPVLTILTVVDTRMWERDENLRWRAIPGSGEDHVCERCGRVHQVHAVVAETVDGKRVRTFVVGQTCAKAMEAHGKERLGRGYVTTRQNGAAFDRALAMVRAAGPA